MLGELTGDTFEPYYDGSGSGPTPGSNQIVTADFASRIPDLANSRGITGVAIGGPEILQSVRHYCCNQGLRPKLGAWSTSSGGPPVDAFRRTQCRHHDPGQDARAGRCRIGRGYRPQGGLIRDLRIYPQTMDAQVLHYKDNTDLEVDAIIESADGRWSAVEVKLGPGMVDQGAATLLAFADEVDTKKCGHPQFLAVITGFGLGYVRTDGVQVVPIGALGP